MFFVSLPEMKGQETEDVSDSIKTLKIRYQQETRLSPLLLK